MATSRCWKTSCCTPPRPSWRSCCAPRRCPSPATACTRQRRAQGDGVHKATACTRRWRAQGDSVHKSHGVHKSDDDLRATGVSPREERMSFGVTRNLRTQALLAWNMLMAHALEHTDGTC